MLNLVPFGEPKAPQQWCRQNVVRRRASESTCMRNISEIRAMCDTMYEQRPCACIHLFVESARIVRRALLPRKLHIVQFGSVSTNS